MNLKAAILLLVAVAYAEANCGCLQCSKHLYVATAPGSPIKVIYRGEPGVPLNYPQPPLPIHISTHQDRPRTVDQIVLQNYDPVFTVGLPLPCKRTYDYKIQAPVQVPVIPCIKKPIKGVSTVDRIVLPAPVVRYETLNARVVPEVEEVRPITQPIIEQIIPSGSSRCPSRCYRPYRYVITENAQAETSETTSPKPASIMNPLYVLFTPEIHCRSKRSAPEFISLNDHDDNSNNIDDRADNINLSDYLSSFGGNGDTDSPSDTAEISPPNSESDETEKEVETTSNIDLHEYLQSFSSNDAGSSSDMQLQDNDGSTEESSSLESDDDCENDPNPSPECTRNKRHIPIISTGLNLLYSLLPTFIKHPIQQSLRNVERDTNQRLAHNRRRRLHEDLLLQRQLRRYNPYVGIPSYYQTPKYHPFRHAPPPPPPPLKRRLSPYYTDSKAIYSEELEDDFLSSLAQPSYSPRVYSRSRDHDHETKSYGRSRSADYDVRPYGRSRDQDYDEYVGSSRPMSGRRSDIPRRNPARNDMTPEERHVFLRKLQKLNARRFRRSASESEDSADSVGKTRTKRSIVLDGGQLGLPFFRVTKLVDNEIDDSQEYEDGGSDGYSSRYFFRADSSEEVVGDAGFSRKKKKMKQREEADEYLNPLDFDNLIPHNPIFYILNTPLRLINHFHNFRKQLSPVLKSVPKVLVSSRRYLQDFGKTFETDVMDFASNIMGRFDDEPHYNSNPWYNVVTPGRYRRSVPEEKSDLANTDGSINENGHNIYAKGTSAIEGTAPNENLKDIESKVTKTILESIEHDVRSNGSQNYSKQSVSGNFQPEYEPVFDTIYKGTNNSHMSIRSTEGHFDPEYSEIFYNGSTSSKDERLHIEERFQEKSQGSDNNIIAKTDNTPIESINIEINDSSDSEDEKTIPDGNFNPEYSIAFYDADSKSENKNKCIKEEHFLKESVNSSPVDFAKTASKKDTSNNLSKVTNDKSRIDGNFYPEYLPIFSEVNTKNEDEENSYIGKRDGNSLPMNNIPFDFSTRNSEKSTISLSEDKIGNLGQGIDKEKGDIMRNKYVSYMANAKATLPGHFHPEYSPSFNTIEQDNSQSLEIDVRSSDLQDQPPNKSRSHIKTDNNKKHNRNIEINESNNVPNEEKVLRNQHNSPHVRKKRYLLKMVDDSEVASFIHQSLGQIMAPFYQDSDEEVVQSSPKKSRKKTCNTCYQDEQDEYKPAKKSTNKRYIIEKLSPKIIIDNNGKPFIEIDGAKRPLILNKNQKKGKKNGQSEDSDDSATASLELLNFDSRISTLIERAKMQAETQEDSTVGGSAPYSDMPVKTIKDKIKQLLAELDYLVAMDFAPYVTIYSELLRLEHLKRGVCQEWKQLVMSDRINDMASKIRLLDDFKKLQAAKDEAVKHIARVLQQDHNNFMTKKLIKMLVRLQKLQCIIFKAVEDAEEKLHSGGNFDINTEIKYIDHLCGLKFVVGRSRQDLERDLKKERDEAVAKNMALVEKLRELLEMPDDCDVINDVSRLLWETKNLEKLQRDTINSLNDKIKRKQKIRKELKILFDLMRQIEANDQKQNELLRKTKKQTYGHEYFVPKSEKYFDYVAKKSQLKDKYGAKRGNLKEIVGASPKRRRDHLRHHITFEDKKPAKITSKGYSLRGYKHHDAFK